MVLDKIKNYIRKYPQILFLSILFVAQYFGFEVGMGMFMLGAWSAGGALATARYSLAGAGTQSAGLSFGGNTSALSAVTEEYNGTAWSSGGALATARYSLAGAGTQSAGLSFGGYAGANSAVTEEYTGVLLPTVTTQAVS